jgi:hypothetical protein
MCRLVVDASAVDTHSFSKWPTSSRLIERDGNNTDKILARSVDLRSRMAVRGLS